MTDFSFDGGGGVFSWGGGVFSWGGVFFSLFIRISGETGQLLCQRLLRQGQQGQVDPTGHPKAGSKVRDINKHEHDPREQVIDIFKHSNNLSTHIVMDVCKYTNNPPSMRAKLSILCAKVRLH